MHCIETATVIYLFIRKDLKKRKIGHDRVKWSEIDILYSGKSLFHVSDKFDFMIFPIYNGVMAAMFEPGVHE